MTHKFAREARLEMLDDDSDDFDVTQHIDVSRARDVATHRVQAPVEIHAGNLSERSDTGIRGQTRELQHGGVTCILEKPVLVGNVFYLEFDKAQLDIAPQLTVCERCALISPTAFDVHFAFVEPIAIPNELHGHG